MLTWYQLGSQGLNREYWRYPSENADFAQVVVDRGKTPSPTRWPPDSHNWHTGRGSYQEPLSQFQDFQIAGGQSRDWAFLFNLL